MVVSATRGHAGDIFLKRPEKMRNTPAPHPAKLHRRDFLIRCCQGASAALIPAGMRGFGLASLYGSESIQTDSSPREYHLHPHYTMSRPLEALLLKEKSGLDDFVTEKYADDIASVLAKWSSGLLESPHNVGAIENCLLPDFRGASLRPLESHIVRPGPAIEIRHNTFKAEAALDPKAFLEQLRAALTSFSKILTAEFQVTGIDLESVPLAPSAVRLQSSIRYELVGAGREFYREQRVGYWQITWERNSESAPGKFHVRNWMASDETQSRSTSRCYVDIAASALGGNSSYGQQLVHGTDYWRTALDGA